MQEEMNQGHKIRQDIEMFIIIIIFFIFIFILNLTGPATVHLLENHEAANWSLRQGDEEVNKIKEWNDPLFIFSITLPAVSISLLF